MTVAGTAVELEGRGDGFRLFLLWGSLALVAAIPVAWIVYALNEASLENPQQAIVRVAAVFAVLLVLPQLALWLRRGRRFDLAEAGLVALLTIAVLLVGTYLGRLIHYVWYPADILLWSESDFINDIIKLRAGYPLYSAEANNESFFYTPGSQVVTYLLGSLVGQGDSIPVLRTIQLLYAAGAALIAALVCRRLMQFVSPGQRVRSGPVWAALWTALLFLFATNNMTNTYVFNLHNDALALLVTMIAYWALVEYSATRSPRWLAVMAVMPALGFMVKQSLLIWLMLYGAWLLFFDRPRSWQRIIGFGAAAAGVVAVTVGLCFLIWGGPFYYWVFDVMSQHGVSPVRSFEHLLAVWPYVAIGMVGALVLLRGTTFDRLFGLWLVWLVLIATEIYTSGVASMLNHIGPGSVIAGVWLLVALQQLWPRLVPATEGRLRLESLTAAGAGVLAVALTLNGLGTVRIPVRPLSPDAHRYAQEIEREFAGVDPATVLIDAGSWVYLNDGVIMKDRAPSIGERGYSATGDFSAFIQRLEQKQYAKILVRNLHSEDFWYDHGTWDEPSGIRAALLANYEETGRIKAVHGKGPQADNWYLFREISVLTPRME